MFMHDAEASPCLRHATVSPSPQMMASTGSIRPTREDVPQEPEIHKEVVINGARWVITLSPIGEACWTWTAIADNVILLRNKEAPLASAQAALTAAEVACATQFPPMK